MHINCEGGWLIIGIDDKSKELKPIKKYDYSQKIGKIATRITPMPEFSTRFITMPHSKNEGILLVYVYEGRNAPYVCNGSIYVRSGSSKEPIKPADRGNIEYLYERSKEHITEIEARQNAKTLEVNLSNIANMFEDFRYAFGKEQLGFTNFFNDFIHIVCDYAIQQKKIDEE